MDNSNQQFGLKRVVLRELEPDLNNILLVGVIIGKQRPRRFSDSKTNDTRAVWNFTLRDSPRDYINVTYWGKSDEVFAANDKFYTGDVVEIRRPSVFVRKFNDTGEQFRPMVTSPFSLTLNESSEILSYSGDTSIFRELLCLPTKPIPGFVPLRDIHNQGAAMKDRLVDILGAVRSVGTIRNVTTKNGEEAQLRELILFDYTNPGLKITIWDTDIMTRASLWKPRQTILFITDAKIEWSNFLRSYSATLTNRSIVTENPVGKEAANLAEYAKDAPLEASAILDQLVVTLPDPESIQNIMSIQQIYNRINSFVENNGGTEQQITALMFVFVTKLDLDGFSRNINTKWCSLCKSYVKDTKERCQNVNCPTVTNSANPEYDISFDIRVNLTDHTGTLINCRLTGQTAEVVLGCSVLQFLHMTDQQKSILKWKFLMERCAVRIMVLLLNRNNPVISIISCVKADPLETVRRMPVF